MVCEGVLLPVAVLGPKMTRLFTLLADWTCKVLVFPVFKMDVGDLVDMLDRDESEVPAVGRVRQKSEFGTRL